MDNAAREPYPDIDQEKIDDDGGAAQINDWIAQAQAGSQEATSRLLELCRAYLLSIANRELDSNLHGKLGASDLVQETLMEAHQGIQNFNGGCEAELLGWLRRILQNNMRDVRRRYAGTDKRRIDRERSLADRSDLAYAAATETPSRITSHDEQSERLLEAMSRLPVDYRTVIELRNWQLLSFSEIGHRMQRSEDAARKLWVRAIDRLRCDLEKTP